MSIWSSCYFYDQFDVDDFISGSSAFSKLSWYIWKFSVHVLLKPCLENFEHYFASMWNECNCAIVWTFFGIAFPWDWNENWPFPVLWPLLSFPNCWHIEHSTLTASSLRIWNSSAGISSLPLALFVVMFPKVYHARNLRLSSSDTLIRYDPLNLFVTSTARDLIWVIPEWPSGFPYFLQFKPEFCNMELIIWATVSSRSCFCWLYWASPSSATKNIVNLIYNQIRI